MSRWDLERVERGGSGGLLRDRRPGSHPSLLYASVSPPTSHLCNFWDRGESTEGTV